MRNSFNPLKWRRKREFFPSFYKWKIPTTQLYKIHYWWSCLCRLCHRQIFINYYSIKKENSNPNGDYWAGTNGLKEAFTSKCHNNLINLSLTLHETCSFQHKNYYVCCFQHFRKLNIFLLKAKPFASYASL